MYENIRETETYKAWYAKLKDARAKSRIDMRIKRLNQGNAGYCEPIGKGCSELKIDYGQGYRVYFKDTGKIIYVLLCGGDKNTQSKDIKKALELAENLEEFL